MKKNATPWFSIGIFLLVLGVSDSVFAQETICHKYVQINPTQEPSMGPRCRVVGDVFYLDGMVGDEMFYELRDHAPHAKVIELNSYGGLVEPAYKIAELVRARGMHTNVRKGAKCASACTLIYQAGVRRTAYPLTRFLYHGARLSNAWVEHWLETRLEKGREKAREELALQFIEVKAETEKFFQQIIAYGAAPALVEKYRGLPIATDWFEDGNFTRTQDWIVRSTQLVNYNVVQEFDFRESVPE